MVDIYHPKSGIYRKCFDVFSFAYQQRPLVVVYLNMSTVNDIRREMQRESRCV